MTFGSGRARATLVAIMLSTAAVFHDVLARQSRMHLRRRRSEILDPSIYPSLIVRILLPIAATVAIAAILLSRRWLTRAATIAALFGWLSLTRHAVDRWDNSLNHRVAATAVGTIVIALIGFAADQLIAAHRDSHASNEPAGLEPISPPA